MKNKAFGKLIDNIVFYDRDDGYVEILISHDDNKFAEAESVLICKDTWYRLLAWLIKHDDVMKRLIQQDDPLKTSEVKNDETIEYYRDRAIKLEVEISCLQDELSDAYGTLELITRKNKRNE